MENQELVIVKDSFLSKIAKAFKKIFSRDKDVELLLNEGNENNTIGTEVELIQGTKYVQLEILDARRAYRKYVINNNKNISNEIFDYIQNKLQENETEINKLIEINKDEISFENILEYLEKEKKNNSKFKLKNEKTGSYNVPVGVIGIECENAKDAIQSMFKAISTRNSIMVLHDNFSKYSTESLILLIIKECLKNFYVDENLIQMFEKEEIDLNSLDRVILNNKNNDVKTHKSNTIYIYQENDAFENDVRNEVERLQNNDRYKSYDIKPIKGEFGNVINYLNSQKEAPAVCMYTNNTQRAYKFINWINSPNVFVNTGIQKNIETSIISNNFYNSKYVLHEDVF